MFFGLTNSPATFQTMMDGIFKDLISKGVVVVYLDDILIFTKTLDEHWNVVCRVMELLQKHGLSLKPVMHCTKPVVWLKRVWCRRIEVIISDVV